MRLPHEHQYFSKISALDTPKSFFFVGIAGSGMTPLAMILKEQGHRVRGTNRDDSSNVKALREKGIEVILGHKGELIEPEDFVIFTDAIWLDESPEFMRARELKCPLFRRSQLLGWILRNKKVVAITGTHGKTTTTGLVAAGLRGAEIDPTIIIGAEVKEFGGSFIWTDSEWAVVEACEAYEGYLDIAPQIVVLTNLEPDHLDHHKNFDGLKQSMKNFVSKLPQDGTLVYCGEDLGSLEIGNAFEGKKNEYFTADYPGLIQLSGAHNILNAAGAYKACTLVTENRAGILNGIDGFKGAKRRMEIHFDEDVTAIDDYAHHPTEIRATICALREKYPGRRIVYTFQPQLYSRTQEMYKEFAEELNKADHVVMTDIYPSREEPVPGVSSGLIFDLIKKPVSNVPSVHLLPRFLAEFAKKGDVLIGSGVGNIGEIGPVLAEELKKRDRITRIAIVYGGTSNEREVSYHSAKRILTELKSLGYDAFMIDIVKILITTGDLREFLNNRPDLILLEAYHGMPGEDGSLAGLCELLHIPYSSSGILAHAIGANKYIAKGIAENIGISVAKGSLFTEIPKDVPSFDYPVVVKPNDSGSTLGLSFVSNPNPINIKESLEKAFAFGKEVLIEEWIQEGIELTVPILNGHALPIIEILPHSGQYDFISKYQPGATLERKADISEEIRKKVEDYALRIYHEIGCKGLTRVDLILKDNECIFLEINTLPGFTGTSLVPLSAEIAGLSFRDLCEQIIGDALKKYGRTPIRAKT